MSTYFTEQRVLQMAACQGTFSIGLFDSSLEEKKSTVKGLVDSGYLVEEPTNKKLSVYTITEQGKTHLKILNGHIPKQEAYEEIVSAPNTKGDLLEAVILKRLNILRNANKRGLEFNLTDSNVRSLLNKTVCYYTGVEFDSGFDPLNVRTFERIDDSKGYIQGNVVAVTLRANRIKNMLLEQNNELKISAEQFISMAEKIKKHK